MPHDALFREQLQRLLAWEDAHVGFETAVAGLPENLRGSRPPGLPHSPWEILEHLRRTQRDILEFCRNSKYEELTWPDDYWPSSPLPPSAKAWDESIQLYLEDRKELQKLAADSALDLGARIPHGSGQTYLREFVLVADHSSYHLGQLVLTRRMLGAWK